MDFVSLVLLIALAGSCGGLTSAIAENRKDSSYTVKIPFQFDQKRQEARSVPLGCLGNILIGAAASISIFFVVGPLFNLEPKAPAKDALPVDQQDSWLSIPPSETILYAKLFSLSVASGFAGISLLPTIAGQIMRAVSKGEEEKPKQQRIRLVSARQRRLKVLLRTQKISAETMTTEKISAETTTTAIGVTAHDNLPPALIELPAVASPSKDLAKASLEASPEPAIHSVNQTAP
ncbi:hypothetical protein [Leptolyngbya sp. FACHB-261]|uniref:hypothetical protein n=1 Tax=Leptolyngbya sp. FACHB-261 TaxID=2692806 RepID=UPI00168242D6|nr:hypothetical protein [Leptolyngbya sp. FACHB-261]MBD2100623.1 hypothetical protein [Leptolyngbya sp. FACHB-261]